MEMQARAAGARPRFSAVPAARGGIRGRQPESAARSSRQRPVGHRHRAQQRISSPLERSRRTAPRRLRKTAMADKTATIKLPDGKTLEFPVFPGSVGPDVVDIRKLYGQSGMFTYHPGFMSTAACTSPLT